ncbi:hypothetical protein ELI_11215 [Erythrobacter litoralis HTCC2594]|uniref:Xanthine dehydrogenase n=2 Tax=Erythrobacter litoralis TaxID=39960 RepID=Q2N7K6_ERYLH|nr:hypothetical protein ELI_11215 [Erythrobacter litoralis HTCC2594]
MRNPGTVMGVAEDGSYQGSLSGGCIEQAVVAEARAALDAGTPRIVRFGAGSPYLDIRLPCGGGLNIHFQPLSNGALAEACLHSIEQRNPFAIRLDDDGAHHVAGWHGNAFDGASGTGTFSYWPAPKIAILGHGAGVEALHRQARAIRCRAAIFTPDEQIVAELQSAGAEVALLARTDQTEDLHSDPWTAFAFLFHDHDWEVKLMQRALELPHFYIGAMGGRQAHAARREALADGGVEEDAIDTIRAPIGLFHSSRDPDTLALSALGEIVRTYQQTDFEAARG